MPTGHLLAQTICVLNFLTPSPGLAFETSKDKKCVSFLQIKRRKKKELNEILSSTHREVHYTQGEKQNDLKTDVQLHNNSSRFV